MHYERPPSTMRVYIIKLSTLTMNASVVGTMWCEEEAESPQEAVKTVWAEELRYRRVTAMCVADTTDFAHAWEAWISGPGEVELNPVRDARFVADAQHQHIFLNTTAEGIFVARSALPR